MHEALGKGKLVKRLGEYQPPILAIQVETPAQTYSKHREPASDQNQRDQASEERAQARRLLRGQYDEWKAGQSKTRLQDKAAERVAVGQRQKDLTEHHKARREQIRKSGLAASVKKALYSVAAMEAVQDREKLRAELDVQRQAERASKPQNFKEWTADRAQEGDQAAISQLRGWAYADRRKAKEMEKADQERSKQDSILGQDKRAEPISPRRVALLDTLQYQVDRKTGDVHYHAQERHVFVFTDSGQRITFSVAGAADREALAAGLLLARQKFGQQIMLTGSDQFKDEAIKIMVEKRMDVRLGDPALEARRTSMEAARDLVKPRQERNQEIARDAQKPSKEQSRGGWEL